MLAANGGDDDLLSSTWGSVLSNRWALDQALPRRSVPPTATAPPTRTPDARRRGGPSARRRSGRRPSAGRRRRRSPGGPARAGRRARRPAASRARPHQQSSRARSLRRDGSAARARQPRWCTARISRHIASSESRSDWSGWSGTSSICIRNSVGRSSGARNSSHSRRPPKPSGPIMARHWRCRSACVRSGATSWIGRRGGMSSSMSRSLVRRTLRTGDGELCAAWPDGQHRRDVGRHRVHPGGCGDLMRLSTGPEAGREQFGDLIGWVPETSLRQRPRRLRTSPAMRAMVAQTSVEQRQLVLPVFWWRRLFEPRPDQLDAGSAAHAGHAPRGARGRGGPGGLGGVILFGVPATKDAGGSGAIDAKGPVAPGARGASRTAAPGLVRDGGRVPRRVHRPRPLRRAERRRRSTTTRRCRCSRAGGRRVRARPAPTSWRRAR